jgi:hypothetical protein
MALSDFYCGKKAIPEILIKPVLPFWLGEKYTISV